MKRKDLKLLLVLVGIVAFIALYLGVYNNYNDKTTVLQGEIVTLTQRLDSLKTYQSNEKTYKDAIEKSSEDAKKTVLSYPNEVRSEDQIMFGVDLENELGIQISTISMSEFQLLSTFPAVIEGDEGYAMDNLRLYKTSASYATSFNYDTLKELLSYIRSRPYRTTLNNISLSYDNSTGNLYANFTVDKFYLAGLDGTYYPTIIGEVDTGTDNIFGTVTP